MTLQAALRRVLSRNRIARLGTSKATQDRRNRRGNRPC